MSPIAKSLKLLAPIIALLFAGGCDREKAGQEQASLPQANIAPHQAAPAAARKPAYHIDRSQRGRAASGAVFTGPDDSEVRLADFRGRPVLLNLWATWCAPCLKEMPSLDRLAHERGAALTVLAVAQDIQGAAVVDPWFAQAGLTHLQPYLDPANHLLADYNSPLPVTILFDAQGRELWRVTGAIDWQGETAKRLLAEAER